MDHTTAVDAGQPEHEHRRSLRSAAYLTIGTAAAHAILFLLAFWLVSSSPGPKASDAELLAFYSSDASRRLVLVGLYIMPFAGIAFMWFIVALRMWLAHFGTRENALLSNIQLVSGIIYICLFLASAAASSTLAASIEFSEAPVDAMVARQFPQFGSTLVLVFAIRMAATFVISSSNIARASGVLPRWFTIGGLVVGVFMLLSVSLTPLLVLLFPLWLLTLCVLLFLRVREIPADATLPPRGEALGQARQT